jgi:hypothetical protein
MAVKSKEEILEYLKGRMGEEPDDESIAFLEDVTDTFSDFETKLGDTEDWKAKYEANDKEWRKKYTDRFFTGEPEDVPDADPSDPPEKHSPMTFEELFTEETKED